MRSGVMSGPSAESAEISGVVSGAELALASAPLARLAGSARAAGTVAPRVVDVGPSGAPAAAASLETGTATCVAAA